MMKELPADSQNKIWGGNGSLISYLQPIHHIKTSMRLLHSTLYIVVIEYIQTNKLFLRVEVSANDNFVM